MKKVARQPRPCSMKGLDAQRFNCEDAVAARSRVTFSAIRRP
jgi:hypothetical protein